MGREVPLQEDHDNRKGSAGRADTGCHAITDATFVEQHATRHAYIVRGVDGRFAVRSDYAVPTAVIVYWPE